MWFGGFHRHGGGGDGLPFAGIPSELAEGVQRILDREPEYPEPDVEFSQRVVDETPFTLRSFLAPHKTLLLGAGLLIVLETATNLVGPLLTGWAIDYGVRPGKPGTLVLIFIAYLLAIIINAVTNWGRISFTGWFGEQMMLKLRVRVFSHLQRLSLDFFTGEKAGRLMTRMTSDIEALTQLFQEGIIQLFVQGLTLLIIITILYALSPKLAVITILIVIPVMVVLTSWFRVVSDRGYERVRDRIADVLADLSESLAGIRIIAAHNRRRHNVIHHNNTVGEYFDANVYMAKIGALYSSATEVTLVIGRALLFLFGGGMVLSGDLSIGELISFLLYLTYFNAPIETLVQLYNQFQSGQAAVKKLQTLLGTPPGVPEKEDAAILPAIKGEIDLKDVSFSYTPGNPVLTGINLHIPEGETFALVGPTGAGKSTIAKLITRFYDPDEGAVCIDGNDLTDVTHHSLRSQLGVVPQEAFLFNGSIRDNIAFSNPDAADEEVMEACRIVGIDDLIERLPMGLDTPCHERGVSLSSGERQLIALARAFLSRPRVLVLDEATSNLDLKSESKIERALDIILEGRTAVIIAHRLATAMRGNRIAVVDEGRIVEIGSHDELVAKNGQYAEMYATYLEHMDGKATPGKMAI